MDLYALTFKTLILCEEQLQFTSAHLFHRMQIQRLSTKDDIKQEEQGLTHMQNNMLINTKCS